MLDYHLLYGPMAVEDRLRDLVGQRRPSKPLRPHRRIHLIPQRHRGGAR